MTDFLEASRAARGTGIRSEREEEEGLIETRERERGDGGKRVPRSQEGGYQTRIKGVLGRERGRER